MVKSLFCPHLSQKTVQLYPGPRICGVLMKSTDEGLRYILTCEMYAVECIDKLGSSQKGKIGVGNQYTIRLNWIVVLQTFWLIGFTCELQSFKWHHNFCSYPPVNTRSKLQVLRKGGQNISIGLKQIKCLASTGFIDADQVHIILVPQVIQ